MSNFLKKVFSVNNKGNHKVVKLFGLKAKFKRKKIAKTIKIKNNSIFEETLKIKTNPIFEDNYIYYNDERIFSLDEIENVKLNISGCGHIIKLNAFLGRGTLNIIINGKDNTFVFGKNNTINQTIYSVYSTAPGKIPVNSMINIGSGNIFNGSLVVLAPFDSGKKVEIGNNNLFAGNINIKGGSEHLVFDISTKIQLNKEENIILKDNIWICENVTILNKTKISSNSVVALSSIVNSSFDKENVLIAGSPARIKKENIMWHIAVDDSYLKTQNHLEIVSD